MECEEGGEVVGGSRNNRKGGEEGEQEGNARKFPAWAWVQVSAVHRRVGQVEGQVGREVN